MKCQCLLFPEGGCPTHHGRKLNEKHWKKCQTDDRAFDGLQALGPQPTLADRAKNATTAAKRATKAKACGQQVKADTATITARQSACEECPARDGQWCQHRKCGCFLPLKATLLTETCPLGKWPKPTAGDEPEVPPRE